MYKVKTVSEVKTVLDALLNENIRMAKMLESNRSDLHIDQVIRVTTIKDVIYSLGLEEE